jgi:hypothetical protein
VQKIVDFFEAEEEKVHPNEDRFLIILGEYLTKKTGQK